ncbi:serine/threonine protein kinase, partial [Nonomuraea sp. K274]
MSDATPTLVAGRYRLDELIGSGPMGEVWRGYDTRADWVVAVKVLGARAAGAATREVLRQHAQAVAKVIHPNVAMVLDVGDHNGSPFLVMEHLTGLSLGEERAARGSMKVVEVCDLVGQAAAGLDAAHRAGVVHGRVDPGGFRRAGTGVLKVVGFGLDDQEPSSGDGRYTAPERAAGGKAEAPGDLYALGCVCYELLCGRPPFDGPRTAPSDAAEPGTSPGRAEPAPPSAFRAEVPAELDRLVLAMIAEDPAKRPASGEAVRRALAVIARPRADLAAAPMDGGATAPGRAPGGPTMTGHLPGGAAVTGHLPGGAAVAGAAHGMGGPAGAYGTGGPREAAPFGATEVHPLGGVGTRAGDTAVYQAGDLEPEPPSNRKLFVQLGVAVAAIVAVTVGVILMGGAGEEPEAGSTQ